MTPEQLMQVKQLFNIPDEDTVTTTDLVSQCLTGVPGTEDILNYDSDEADQ